MLRNYLKIAFRNLLRFKFFSFINIYGLAVGIACCIVVALFVKDELSYDKHHDAAGRIHRVVKDFVNDDGTRIPDATTPPALAFALQNEVPEVEKATRVFPGWGRKYYVRKDEKGFLEEAVYRVDSSFFDVFTVPFLRGDKNTAFNDLKSVVLTESTSRKYFGREDALGKTVALDNMGTYQVTGVIKDVPRTSHFKYDLLISTRTIGGDSLDYNWDWYNFYTYIKLKKQSFIATAEPKIKSVFKKHQPQSTNFYYTQPLTSIHLHSSLKWELQPNSDKKYIYIVVTIALFIIVIAGINYVNLSTARSSLRAKEIGVRKVTGAARSALIQQFLIESVLISLLATMAAVALAQAVLPAINNITQKNLSLFNTANYDLLGAIIGSAVLLGLLAGFYPAVFLSSFEPVKVLKGLKQTGHRGFNLRKVLVVSQFCISIALIIGILIIHQQVRFIQSTKLGFDKEQVAVIPDIGYLERSQIRALKNSFLEVPGVKKVASMDGIIGGQNWTNDVRLKGSQNNLQLNFINIDADFLETMGMELKDGRGFSPQFPSDTADAIILNEAAVKQLNIPQPVIGQQIVWGEDEDTTYYAKVIGVVKDFHYTSFRNEIMPFGFVTDNNRQWYFSVKLDAANIGHALAAMKKVWDTQVSSRPFQYSFLDETFDKLYRSERNFRSVFFYITLLTIIIACLGLLGLASFTTEQRVKEIGIRKVLGASVAGIVALLSKDFLKLILIAALIAVPLAWYAMQNWLQDFAYRISVPWWVFIAAGLAAVVIAMLTISFQAVKAAMTNPVKNLRTE